MLITIPRDLSARSLARFASELQKIPEVGVYTFDFGPQRWFPPFSMLFLASILRQFKSQHPNSQRVAQNHDNHPYAAHFGFFNSFGLSHGNQPGEALGSSRYLPINELSVNDLKLSAIQSFREVGDILDKKAGDLAAMLTLNEEDTLQETLTYSMREIFRNVVEHSSAEKAHYCAQYWPSRNEVEVGIADDGIGIHASLNQNPSFDEIEEIDAIQLALLPGISGNPFAGKGRNVWNNSGYGLYMTNRICRNGGKFSLISGGHGIELSADGKDVFDTKIQGTMIRMLINTSNIPKLNEQLRIFAEEGRIAARELNGANTNIASAASQMLSQDFKI